MRQIRKNREPVSLAAYRPTPGSNYEDFQFKDDLRSALTSEQKGLCCYCMAAIAPSSKQMKIEHWRCQSRYPEKELDYQNLLAACQGGNGSPKKDQHCDTLKGDLDLLFNPADPTHQIEARIQYLPDGTVSSPDPTFDDQLNKVLGLNLPRLKTARKLVLDGIIQWWKLEKGRLRGPIKQERLQRGRDRFVSVSGPLPPFAPVAAWWLSRKIRSLQ